MLQPYELRVEYLVNPIGMDEPRPRFFWKLRGSGLFQREYCLIVRSEKGNVVWNTGFVKSDQSIQVEYDGEPLKPFTRYFWSVSVSDDRGESGVSEEDARFETGFMGTPWTAKWIRGNPSGSESMRPVRRIFKLFQVKPGIRKARLYLTALGIAAAQLNGKSVSEDDWFLPGWTDYRHRVQYGAFDILPFLREGDNMLSADLADGWFNGRIARWRNGGADAYGSHTLLKQEIRLEAEDGSVSVIASDDSFRTIPDPGPVKYSDIYSGEMFDASIDDTRWRLPDSPFAVYAKKDEGNFPTAVDNHSVPCVAENVSPEIIWRRNAGVRHQGSLSPVSIVHTDAGTWLIDFGKDIAGRERMILRNTRAGAVVTVRHGEWLNPDGTLYTANYRSADAMTTYICGGNAEEVYEPRYTWYGFRYMEISGWPGELSSNQITAEILGEPLADAGLFRCSDELVNKWAESVRQTLKNDVFEVPMDCHQRDERLGWTGDAQIFMNTSTYFCQGAAFYTKWIYDVFYGADSQKHGCFPIIAPYFSDDLPFSSVWSDAGIYAPLTMYMKYGDVRLLKEGYVRMSRWLDYQCECQVKPWIVNSSRYKDWLCLGPDTSRELVATACWYGIHLAMIPLARLLERPEDADRWTERAKHIKQAFIQEFYDDDGCIRESSQTAALLALRYGLTDERTERKTLDALLQNIRITNGGHIATGITGTPLMMKTLTQFGQSETAYDLLLQKTAPGWLNEIILGATAVWEHWDSYVPEKGFMDPSMNSFSHCGLGSAGEWLFEGICGIQPLEPGFRSFLLRPNMTDKLDYAEAEFESEYGLIRSAWKHTEDGFEWKIAVPKNTCAKISIPSMERTLNPGNYTVLIRSSGQTAFVN